jgi:type I restriction enzyme S subunit
MTGTTRLPQNWTYAKLGDLGLYHNGRGFKKHEWRADGRPIIRIQNLTGSGKSWNYFQGKVDPRNEASPGDLLVSWAATLGAYIWNGPPAVVNQHIFKVESFVNQRFHYYTIQHAVDELYQKSHGTGMVHVTRNVFDNTEVPLPPLPEQYRIVEAIESYLTRLDAAVALLERVQRNLKRYRASVLKAAVEGRLVPTEAELAKNEGRSYEPASELLERILVERRKKWIENAAEKARAKTEEKARKADKPWTHADDIKALKKARKTAEAKYKQPAPPETADLPDLPEGWCWATIAQLASAKPHSLTDGPFGSNLKTEHYTEAGPRVIRLQNIGDGQFINAEAHISDEHYEQLKKHATYPGDVVIASLGVELPKACLIPDRLGQALVKADCLRLKPNARLVNRHYLMHALNSRPIRRRTEALVHGMGRPRIGLTLLRRIPVPLPPHAEQKRIAKSIDTLLSITENIVQLLERQNLRTARLRQSVLKWAFEGKLVPQDPEDELASALLDRIKAESSASRRYR